MEQPWIHKPKTDMLFLLAPSFVVLGIVLIWHEWLASIAHDYSFYSWLFLIVFIDVAHVYATLFKTYFVPSEFRRRKKLYIGLPIICFVVGMVLFFFGSLVFWSVLAYIAVFHFIRQQYGFMRLYARNEPKTHAWIDNLIIYTATLYPMLFWFLSPGREFNWFVEREFFQFENQVLLDVFSGLYFLVVGFYLFRTLYQWIKHRYFNLPKNAVIVGTGLSWYFGIVYFNNDLVFTLLNVVSHGVPYIALVYLNDIEKKNPEELGLLNHLKAFRGLLLFLAFLLIIAFSEEFLWEILVWNEQFSLGMANLSVWQFILVPLLTVPQFTHYLLDGFIWKRKPKSANGTVTSTKP